MVKRNKGTAAAAVNSAVCGSSETTLKDNKAEKARLAEEPDAEAETWRVYLGNDSNVAAAIPKPGTFDLNKFKLKLANVNKCGEIPTCEGVTQEEADEASEEAFREMAQEGLIYDTGERKWSNQRRRYEIVWKATGF